MTSHDPHPKGAASSPSPRPSGRSPSPASSPSWASASSIRSCPRSPRTCTPRRARSSCCSPATSPITGVSMLVTGWVASRIGAQAHAARRPRARRRVQRARGRVEQHRRDRRLPRRLGPRQRALHRHRAVGDRRRRQRRASPARSILYEAALGLGIAFGPLLGGLLGGDLLARAVLRHRRADGDRLRRDRPCCSTGRRRRSRRKRVSIAEPLRALRHRAARGQRPDRRVFYNFGFFTLLAYTPFPLGLGIHQLGSCSSAGACCWRSSSVFVAPRARAPRSALVRDARRSRSRRSPRSCWSMGVLHASQTALIVVCHRSRRVPRHRQHGADRGSSWSPRRSSARSPPPPTGSCASPAARSRPFLAGKLAEHVSVAAPFYLGARS